MRKYIGSEATELGVVISCGCFAFQIFDVEIIQELKGERGPRTSLCRGIKTSVQELHVVFFMVITLAKLDGKVVYACGVNNQKPRIAIGIQWSRWLENIEG